MTSYSQPSIGVASAATILDTLVDRLRSRDVALDYEARPAAILWTDPDREWLPLIELLRKPLGELLVLGDYAPEQRTGPAIWLRCIVDGTIQLPDFPSEHRPIIYMPGVGRQQLRAGDECPDLWKPLVELMYRGAMWLQPNGSDWTLNAFLTSRRVLGLDIAGDRATREALQRALPEVAVTPLASLRGRHLQADDFDRLLTDDVVRDLLRWIGDPEGTKARLGENGWGAFCSRCREEYGFDPATELNIAAGERLGRAQGAWANVWQRFAETPSGYMGVAALLRISRPRHELALDRERWPDLNDEDEEAVRRALRDLPQHPHDEARQIVLRLERDHGARRDFVWARIGGSPMAKVLEPLARIANGVARTLGGTTPDEIASAHVEWGWEVDAATWEAVASVPLADEEIVENAVRHLVQPWLEDSARAFQAAVDREPLPTAGAQPAIEAGDDVCLMFVDGLRFDLGKRLAERLEGNGYRTTLAPRWAGLPTVTPTGKPAITAAADEIAGGPLGADFAPRFKSDRPTTAANLRAAMKDRSYQILERDAFDAPRTSAARGWLEYSDIDQLGHDFNAGLAQRLPDELERLTERITGLLDLGWAGVRVVTDHGWLLLPGGLPKVELPAHLTESRWSRCAVIAGGATPNVPRAPWYWNPSQWFATPPGIACFKESQEYVHGGISIQECLTPDLLVERPGDAPGSASISSIKWLQLRCHVAAEARGAVIADLRLGHAAGESVVATSKRLEADGTTSLVLDDDTHIEASLVLVLIDETGRVLNQRPTRVGVDS